MNATATKLSTKRLVQIHVLGDEMSSRVRPSLRAALNAASIGNVTASDQFKSNAVRFQRIADACAYRLELSA